MSIERWSNSRSVEIENGTDTTGTIVVGPAAGGLIKFPAGVTSPATWEAKDSAGVWAAIHDDSDAALSSAFTAVKWRPIPEGVLLHSEVRAVTGGNVSGDKTVQIALKG